LEHRRPLVALEGDVTLAPVEISTMYVVEFKVDIMEEREE
jgi:hypothetical protein